MNTNSWVQDQVLNTNTIPVYVGNLAIGAGQPIIMAGPCAVESEEQMMRIGKAVAAAGAHVLRGERYKP